MKPSLKQTLSLVHQHLAAGRLKNAKQINEQILIAHPECAEAFHLQGVIWHNQKNTPMALKCIARAIELDPKVGLYHSNYAEMSRLTGNLDQSISSGKQAVSLAPKLASAHSNLGIAYYDLKEFEKAKTCQKKALSLNPQLASALNNLASISRELNNKPAAIAGYRELLRHHPNYVEGMSNLGAVLTETEDFDGAQNWLIKAVNLSPNHAEAHLNLGNLFLATERFDKANLAYHNALKIKPAYPEAYIGLAKLSHEKFDYEQSKALSLKALELDPKSATAHTCLASALMDLEDTEQAESIIIKGLELSPDSPSLLTLLGNLQTEKGELDLAVETLKQAALLEDEWAITSHLTMTQAKKTQLDDPHFKKLIKAHESARPMMPKKKMSLHFALGKCFDDLEEPDQAFTHFDQACQLKRADIEYSIENNARHTQLIMDSFDCELFERLTSTGFEDASPIFVLGMPRSGSTLTEQIISSHSKVFGGGELPLITDLVNHYTTVQGQDIKQWTQGLTAEKLSEMGKWYGEKTAVLSPDHLRITDKMPINFQYLGLIKLMLPNAKIIHIKRNAVDTCLSCFTKNFKRGQRFSYDQTELGEFYLDYLRLMAHWENVLPKGSFIEVDYEALIADNEAQAKRLIKFCGLRWEKGCLKSHENKRRIRTASVAQVRQPLYTSSVQRWLPYEQHLQPLLKVLGEHAHR